mgnify:CR=1 FL=1
MYYEAIILGLIGTPIGILCGEIATYILIIVCEALLGDALNMELVFSFSWYAILFSIILATITIYLSARKSAKRASKITPLVAIRNYEDIKIKVLRDGQILEFTVHSDMDKSEGSGKIGIMADTSTLTQKQSEKLNFFEALGKGFTDSFEYLSLTIKSIGILFKGVELQNAVSGPARITDMLGSTIQDGFAASAKIGIISILNLLAFISISLFFMNLLPIPVLDGGIILIAFIEMILRKKINPRIQYYIQFIGIAFIAFLFFIGLFGDIKYFFKR